jgi:hypothetical protein
MNQEQGLEALTCKFAQPSPTTTRVGEPDRFHPQSGMNGEDRVYTRREGQEMV